jgi:hypothetical protein
MAEHAKHGPKVSVQQHLLSSTNVNLRHKNHVVALDNWFTSSHSFHWLARNGFVGVGTVGPGKLGREKPTKAGFPNAGVFKKTKARTRAAYVVHKGAMQKDGSPAVDCWVTAWQDRNPVHVLSTYPQRVGSCRRKVRVDGIWVGATYPRPSVVHHYNQSMGGTDLHDQRVAAFRTVVKSKRWQVRVLTDTFSSMMQNAFVLYKQYHDKTANYSSQHFIEAFLKEVAELCSLQHDDSDSENDGREQHERNNQHKRDYWVSGAGSVVRLSGRNPNLTLTHVTPAVALSPSTQNQASSMTKGESACGIPTFADELITFAATATLLCVWLTLHCSIHLLQICFLHLGQPKSACSDAILFVCFC